MTDVNPAYNPRWSPPSTVKVTPRVPVLRAGLDRLPQSCPGCSNRLLSYDPPMGEAMFGALTCTGCGVVLAHLSGPFRPIGTGSRPRQPVATTEATLPRQRLSAPPDRTPGCSVACYGGAHSAGAHEAYGRQQALASIDGGKLQPRPTGRVRTGRLVCDFDQQRVLVDDTIVAVSDLERRVLFYLAEHLGVTCRHWDTVSAVWGYDQAVTWSRESRARNGSGAWHGARIHVHRLRRRLGDAADLIETVPGVGYLLRAEPPEASPA